MTKRLLPFKMKNSIVRSFSRALNGFYLRAQNSYGDRLQQLKKREVNKLFSNFSIKNLRWLSLNNAQPDDDAIPKEKVKFTFILNTGERVDVEGAAGESIMKIATDKKLGMEGACEGSLACTTCHAYVDEKFEDTVSKPSAKEEDMLDVAPFLRPNSRLCCQIILSKDLEGACFKLPPGTMNMAVDGHKPKKH